MRSQFFVLFEPVEPTGPLTDLVDGGDVNLQVTMMNPGGGDPQVAEAFVVATDSVDAPQLRRLVASDDAGLRMIGGEGRRGNGVDTEEIDAYVSRLEHRADAEVRSDATAESWVDGEDENGSIASARLRFEARIDADTGAFAGARAIIGGQLWSLEKHPGTGQRFAGQIAQWRDVRTLLVDLCAFAPQLKFVQFTVTLSARGPVITNVSATPRYNKEFPYLPATVEFLREHIEKKRQRTHTLRFRITRWFHNAKLRLRKTFARALYPAGLVPYQSVRWLEDMARDLLQRNGVPLKTKIWAYRNGFLSYRIPQYGITPENRTQYISDFEYRWLRHINKKYKYWLEDKISIKYVAAEFNEYLPGYYYYTSQRGGRAHLIPMMDRPDGYGESFDEVLRLARDKGVLALKPDEGSHGDGFYRLGYDDGGYTLNGEPATGDQVLAIISDPQNRYLITEFIVMHPTLAQIYPQSVNTVRMTVFKKDGVTPQIGQRLSAGGILRIRLRRQHGRGRSARRGGHRIRSLRQCAGAGRRPCGALPAPPGHRCAHGGRHAQLGACEAEGPRDGGEHPAAGVPGLRPRDDGGRVQAAGDQQVPRLPAHRPADAGDHRLPAVQARAEEAALRL